MKTQKSRLLIAGLGLAVFLGLNDAQAQDKKSKKETQGKPAARPNQQRPVQQQPPPNRPPQPGQGLNRPSQSAGQERPKQKPSVQPRVNDREAPGSRVPQRPGRQPKIQEQPSQGQRPQLDVPPRQDQDRPSQDNQAERRQGSKMQEAKPPKRSVPDSNPSQSLKNPSAKSPGTETQDGGRRIPGSRAPNSQAQRPAGPARKPMQLREEIKPNGIIEKKRPSGALAETVKTDKETGEVRTQRLSPTKRIESEEIKQRDGTIRKAAYDLKGGVKKEEVVYQDGRKQITDHRIGRDGTPRAKETVNYNVNQKIVSKTVEKNVTINKNVNKTVVVNHFDRGRYGYVYRPVYVGQPRVFASWYDPYWYTPVGVAIHRPFRYAWGWESHNWYHHYHGAYWSTYEVYPTPSYWVTDYLVAAYVADHHAATLSAAQAREEARLAREEAAKAKQAAEDARDDAEIAEAQAAAAQAALRARNAEEKANEAERQEARTGKNANVARIDEETKEALRNQIEATIAEQKELAEQSEKTGNPILPDLSRALAEPKRIYPVSKRISVLSAKDDTAAGILSEGDLLKVEPGQESILKDADENTEVLMRVMSSKGEENEVAAGTVVKLFVRDLQEFDSEFRAKLDEGLVAAESNKDLFKQGVVAQN